MDVNFSIYKELASLANTKGQYAKTVKWINSNPTATAEDAKNHRKAINGSLEPVITKGTDPAPSVDGSSDDGTTPNATSTDVEETLAKFNESISTICSNRELFTDHEKLILNGLNKLSIEFGLIPVSPYKKDKVKN